MPFSSNSGKQLVDRTVIRLVKQLPVIFDKNRSVVLDIGAGSGTYSDRYSKTWLRNCEWLAVEIWEPYLEKYKLAEKYDKVFNISAQEYFKKWRFSPTSEGGAICFLGDVIEHLTK